MAVNKSTGFRDDGDFGPSSNPSINWSINRRGDKEARMRGGPRPDPKLRPFTTNWYSADADQDASDDKDGD